MLKNIFFLLRNVDFLHSLQCLSEIFSAGCFAFLRDPLNERVKTHWIFPR